MLLSLPDSKCNDPPESLDRVTNCRNNLPFFSLHESRKEQPREEQLVAFSNVLKPARLLNFSCPLFFVIARGALHHQKLLKRTSSLPSAHQDLLNRNVFSGRGPVLRQRWAKFGTPFRTRSIRACAAEEVDGRVYALGGEASDGKESAKAFVLDRGRGWQARLLLHLLRWKVQKVLSLRCTTSYVCKKALRCTSL